MAVIEKDLGPVSAYAVAVAHGYTGTEAEWEALIANSAINAQSAGASATAAAASAQEAAQQKTQAQAQAEAALAHAQDASRFSQTAGQANSYAQMASSNAAHSATNASNAQTAAEAAQAAAEAAVTGAEAAQTAAEAAVTDAQTAKTAAETAAATAAAAYGTDLLADDYSTSKTYAVGDYVIYSGNLYRCTTAIATAESWTAAHWTQAQVGPDLNDLKSATNPVTNAALSWTDGKYLYVNSSHVVSEQSNEVYACSDYILIPAGMACHVHTWYSGYARTVLYNASKEWIADYQQTSGVMYGVIDIDIAATTADRYVRLSCHVDKKTSAYVSVTKSLATVVNDFSNLPVLANGSRTSTSEQLASLDNAVPNTVYTFTANVDSDTQPSAYGTLLTLNATRDNNGGHAQMFVAWDGKVFTRIKWVRSGVSGFSEWEELTKKVQPFEYADATMFERIGVIGDSFASGVIYATGATTEAGKNYTHYEQSWPQCLGRICGNTVINYSFGGATTKLWLSNTAYGKAKLESDDPCNLYMLCLGINDSNKNTGVALGREADIGTTEDTFYRYYGDIVASIVDHAPNALIVFSTYCRKPTAAQSTTYTAYNNAIKALAEHYDVPCLVLTDDEFFNSDYWMEGMHNSHPTAAQYSGAAKAYNRLLAKSIVDNYSYYSDYNSTPTIIGE